ncbi:MAG: TM0996/MTH895 family glutaredoxin-like protein [Erysipelothrix sp.]|jgi:small redox-active disulfide protein 2|nr:TM0996/MTH895 family glutaredoxin-like protein [Erysipelothrix sp.]
MNIKILGIGCSNCTKLEENAREAVKRLNIVAEFEKVTDPKKFSLYGIMKTPGLVIDGKVVSYGRVTPTDEIVKMIEGLQ